MGPASLCSAADRRNPLQEGCLKSKLPAHHLLLRRSVSQQQNQQKQLFIPFDVGFEVTPPLPLCPPPLHTLLPSPLLFLAQPLQLSLSFTPKETRSCQLLRKRGCFEGAAVRTAFSHFTLYTTESVSLEKKLMGLLHLTYCHRMCQFVNVTFTV